MRYDNYKLMFDEIVVTGSSFSSGYEMNDKILLPKEKLDAVPLPENIQQIKESLEKKQNSVKVKIFKWYAKNNRGKKLSAKNLHDLAFDAWFALEKKKSWPAELALRINCDVKNLSIPGGAIGRNLIEFSNYLKNKNNQGKKIVAIHELPPVGRMYLRFLTFKMNIVPKNFDDLFSMWDKKKYYKDIEKIKKKYKNYILKDIKNNFFDNHYGRCLNRILSLSNKHNVDSYFIFYQSKNIPRSLNKSKIILTDLESFIRKYEIGQYGHPVDKKYNKDLVDLILCKISH
jgi:hypothetical protein